MITMRFDGSYIRIGARDMHHSGIICYGWVIENDSEELASGFGALAHPLHASASLAEFRGLTEGLLALRQLGLENEEIHVIGDAEAIIHQMCGESRVKEDSILKAFAAASSAASCLENISWEWVPRELNQKADALSRMAFENARQNVESFRKISNNLFSCGKKRELRHAYPSMGLPMVSVCMPQFA
ncbi:MAG: reverse transcriptase-like protein [Anaerolineaceae bacterium]